MSCGCACHLTSGTHRATCTIDTGSSGVPDVPSCSPCNPPRLCRRCGLVDDHQRLDGDCVLRHSKPHTRADHGNLCEPCVDNQKDWLREIGDLWARLDEVVLSGSVSEEIGEHMRTKKAPASPAPLRLDAWAMLHPGQLNAEITSGLRLPDGSYEMVEATLGGNLPDVRAILARWAQAAYDAARWTAIAPTDTAGAIAALQANAEALAARDDIALYDTELRWIRRSLRRAHGLGEEKPLGQCLTVTNGRECIGKVWPDRYGGRPKCSRCGRQYSDRDLVKLQITEEMTAS